MLVTQMSEHFVGPKSLPDDGDDFSDLDLLDNEIAEQEAARKADQNKT